MSLSFFPAIHLLNIFYESHFFFTDLMPSSEELKRPLSVGSHWNHTNQPHRRAKHITSIHPLNIKVNITYIRFSAFQTNLFFSLFEMPEWMSVCVCGVRQQEKRNASNIKPVSIFSTLSFAKRQSNFNKNMLWKGVGRTAKKSEKEEEDIEFYLVK